MKLLFAILAILTTAIPAMGCTSMIVSAAASADGRPLMWKHRDTDARNNFLARVEATDSTLAYVALFNEGDSTLSEAWTGMNEAGFAIMNTASYNLAPDTARLKDREGAVMTAALRRCRTVAEFDSLLSALSKPLGVQANFGVIDAQGGAAYFETSDHSWRRVDVADSPGGVLIRTNYSVSGQEGTGFGYIRYNTAQKLAAQAISRRAVTAPLFTESLSRSFSHSLTGHDYVAEDEHYVADRDFIPRNISTASIVIEGVTPGQNPTDIYMWAALGYPPCAVTERVTLTEIPSRLGPDLPGWRSSACAEAIERRDRCIAFPGGSGPGYLDLHRLVPEMMRAKESSAKNYLNHICKP